MSEGFGASIALYIDAYAGVSISLGEGDTAALPALISACRFQAANAFSLSGARRARVAGLSSDACCRAARGETPRVSMPAAYKRRRHYDYFSAKCN